jgi:hypothetical protein
MQQDAPSLPSVLTRVPNKMSPHRQPNDKCMWSYMKPVHTVGTAGRTEFAECADEGAKQDESTDSHPFAQGAESALAHKGAGNLALIAARYLAEICIDQGVDLQQDRSGKVRGQGLPSLWVGGWVGWRVRGREGGWVVRGREGGREGGRAGGWAEGGQMCEGGGSQRVC